MKETVKRYSKLLGESKPHQELNFESMTKQLQTDCLDRFEGV